MFCSLGHWDAVFTGSLADQLNAVANDGCRIRIQEPQYVVVGILYGRLIIFLFPCKYINGFLQDFFYVCRSSVLLFHFKEFLRINYDLIGIDFLSVLLIVVVFQPSYNEKFCAFPAVFFHNFCQFVPACAPEKVSRIISLVILPHGHVGNGKVKYCMCHGFTACTVSYLWVFRRSSCKYDLVHVHTCTS